MSLAIDIGTAGKGANGAIDTTNMICTQDGFDADEKYKRNKKDTKFKRVNTVKCKLLDNEPDGKTKEKIKDYGGVKGLTKVVKHIVKDGQLKVKTVFKNEKKEELEDIDISLTPTMKDKILLVNLQDLQIIPVQPIVYQPQIYLI